MTDQLSYTGLQVYLTAAEDGHVSLSGPQVTAFPAGPWEDTANERRAARTP